MTRQLIASLIFVLLGGCTSTGPDGGSAQAALVDEALIGPNCDADICQEGLKCVILKLQDGDQRRCVDINTVCDALRCPDGYYCVAAATAPLQIFCAHSVDAG